MTRYLNTLLFSLMLGFAPALLADEAKPDNEARDKAISAVIADQLDAFSKDDAERAFSHASPMIRGVFKDPERFVTMVKRSYGMIYAPEFHELEKVISRAGKLYMTALFVDKDNNSSRAYYEMQKQDDDSWKINGVFLEKVKDKFV